jgi:hypothetical protein
MTQRVEDHHQSVPARHGREADAIAGDIERTAKMQLSDAYDRRLPLADAAVSQRASDEGFPGRCKVFACGTELR